MRQSGDEIDSSFSLATSDAHVMAAMHACDRYVGAGNLSAATSSLASSLDHLRPDSALKSSVAERFMMLADQWCRFDRRQELNALRVGLAIAPDDPLLRNKLDHFLAGCTEPAKLTDYTQEFAEEELGHRLLVACFVKSASTFLSNLLADLTGWPLRYLTYAFMQNEEELHLPYLLATARENSVTQQHCRATAANIHLVQAFKVRPIVQVRNIFDSLLSYKEFLDVGAHVNTFYPAYASLSEVQRMELVVDDRAAWYLSFYAGWDRAMRQGLVNGTWVTYEDLTGDVAGTLERILQSQGLAAFADRIPESVARVGSDRSKQRFNRGKVGRGATAFTDEQVARVRRIAAYHPDVDFSRIGL